MIRLRTPDIEYIRSFGLFFSTMAINNRKRGIFDRRIRSVDVHRISFHDASPPSPINEMKSFSASLEERPTNATTKFGLEVEGSEATENSLEEKTIWVSGNKFPAKRLCIIEEVLASSQCPMGGAF